jgi:hypothetical protein
VLHDLVYITGNNTVDKANATSIATVPAIGFVTLKPTTTSCLLTYYGEVAGFAGLIPGAIYYLSTTVGLMTTTAPSASGDVVQKVGVARTPKYATCYT